MNREELLKIAKPILFNTEMVGAILEGRKTVTRRVLKLPKHVKQNENGLYTLFAEGTCYENQSMDEIKEYIKPPFQAGDYLYVRETIFQAVGHTLEMSGETRGYTVPIFEYVADGKHTKGHWQDKRQFYWMNKRPSIHMPKEAARIFLKVTNVRVERLQDMDKTDALKEGIDSRLCVNLSHALTKFKKLWNSTIKKADKDKYGWDANPWVWVIEFERVEV